MYLQVGSRPKAAERWDSVRSYWGPGEQGVGFMRGAKYSYSSTDTPYV